MSKPVKRIVVETIRTSKGLFVAGDEPQEIPADLVKELDEGGFTQTPAKAAKASQSDGGDE